MLIIKNKKIKKILSWVLVAAFLFLVGYLKSPQNSVQKVETPTATQNNLRVIFLDVGQGDASLVITPEGQTILVDGGPDDKILSQLGKFLPLSQKKIDVVILTHPHADHLDGLVEVLRRYEVGEVYYSGFLHTTGSFLEWLKMINDKNIQLVIVKEKKEIKIGEVGLEFLYPNHDFSGLSLKEAPKNNLNNTSVVFRLNYKQTQFLFVGDVEIPVEQELVGGQVDLSATVLKVGHHGSNSSTSEEFLNLVSPQYAVISVGVGNDFGHPHLRTLRRLERHGIKFLRTDEDGNIEIISDGQAVKIKNPQSKAR